MPSVDVVIPNFQYAAYLRECVLSVLGQGLDQLRVLIIDNASTDDSVRIAEELARGDPRIEVRVHPVNLGFHASVNEGLDWAKSDYVMVLCSDDLLPPGALLRAVAALEAHPTAAFAYGPYVKMVGPERIIKLGDEPYDVSRSPIYPWFRTSGRDFIAEFCQRIIYMMSPLVRTSIQKKVGHYRPELEQTSDLEVLLRLASLGDVVETPTIQGIQRIHGANLSTRSWRDPVLSMTGTLGIFDSFFTTDGNDLPNAAVLYRSARKSVAVQAYWRGIACLKRLQPGAAIGLFKLAFGLAPSLVVAPPFGYLVRRLRVAERHPVGVRNRIGSYG